MYKIVDMFCGGGGESTGIMSAAEKYGFKIQLSAINHWQRAIETHAENYPEAHHFCESVQNLQPEHVVPDGKLDLLWASPECTHHSIARGGKPREEQGRASAWEILRWLSLLYVERVIIENVPEFLSWGPLDENGKTIEKSKGKTFQAFINGLKSLGYTVDWRILCAADYGAPTTRRRLFIQAVKGRKKIKWPQFTNMEYEDNLFHLPKWRSAAEVIDWNLPCQSIFSRSRPLADATLRRIAFGIEKYWGDYAEPFLTVLRGTSTTRKLEKPLPTITCSGAHFGLVKPFISAICQTSAKSRNRSIDKPLSTICTKQEHCLVEPFITEYYGNGQSRSIHEPLSTITTHDRFGLVSNLNFDIGFRMLQPHELAAATGFPSYYKFSGNKQDQVKQIGNAVPPSFAEALVSEILKEKVS